MIKFMLFPILIWSILACSTADEGMGDPMDEEDPMEQDSMPIETFDTLRFASYNVSMFGNTENQIASQMDDANQFSRYKRLAAVIQIVRPDVLVLMEFDYDSTGETLRKFNDNLLTIDQGGYEAIDYEYQYQIDSNTGDLSNVDIDGDGKISLPNDAFGFGNFKGQYASAILSKYPLDLENIRSFRKFLWKSMPDALLPINGDGSQYYSQDALEVFRLSSKNHVDIPIILPGNNIVHALISHPTPPVFDGSEDRNGKRNHDEIRFFSDYISGESYIVDDQGTSGGLNANDSFIIFGDLNADPFDGDSYLNAINRILDNEFINSEFASGPMVPRSNGGAEHNQRTGDIGDPSNDTSFFGLRVDYVLLSKELNAINSGVFWPSSSEEGYDVIKDGIASDHLLVWVDIVF